jgi:hypothetical protein
MDGTGTRVRLRRFAGYFAALRPIFVLGLVVTCLPLTTIPRVLAGTMLGNVFVEYGFWQAFWFGAVLLGAVWSLMFLAGLASRSWFRGSRASSGFPAASSVRTIRRGSSPITCSPPPRCCSSPRCGSSCSEHSPRADRGTASSSPCLRPFGERDGARVSEPVDACLTGACEPGPPPP